MSKRALNVWFVLSVAGVIGGAILFWVAFAHAQTSQPVVVAPVAAPGVWAWIVANSPWLVPLVINLAATLATGLSNYPQAKGFVSGLRIFIAILGNAQFRDAPGSLKSPLLLPTVKV